MKSTAAKIRPVNAGRAFLPCDSVQLGSRTPEALAELERRLTAFHAHLRQRGIKFTRKDLEEICRDVDSD